MERRTFLKLWAVAAAAPMVLVGCPADEPQPEPSTCADPVADGAAPWDEDPEAWPIARDRFPLVPQTGAMRSDSALLMVHCDEGLAPSYHLWRQEGDDRLLVRSGSVTSVGGVCRVVIDGLAAGTWYHVVWFFEAADAPPARSVIGRFRTALAAGCAAPLKVVATSCTNQRTAPWIALQQMAEEAPDLFLQLGDMSYNDRASTPEQYRASWRATLRDPGYEALLPACGMYITWDDHEIVDNSSYYQIDEARRSAGTEAFFEHVATPRLGGDRFWDSYRWGDTAEFFVLDSRSERIPSSRHDDDATYISRAQMDWLKGALAASTAQWKVIMSSVAMTDWPPVMIMEVDRWEGYAAQRKELLDAIDSAGVEGVLVLGGDFHCGAVSRLDPSGKSSNIFEVLVGPGGNGGNPAGLIWEMGSEAERDRTFPPGQFYFISPYTSTTTLVFDPQAGRVEVTFRDPETETVRYGAALTLDGQVEPLS